MPKAGDRLNVFFNSEAPLPWGTHRYHNSRTRRSGERYIPIPRKEAKRLGLRNSNCGTGFGINLFNVHSTDGHFSGVLMTAGCSRRGDMYAKQFQGYGNLRALLPWLELHNAQVGDEVQFDWTSTTDIEMKFISHHDE